MVRVARVTCGCILNTSADDWNHSNNIEISFLFQATWKNSLKSVNFNQLINLKPLKPAIQLPNNKKWYFPMLSNLFFFFPEVLANVANMPAVVASSFSSHRSFRSASHFDLGRASIQSMHNDPRVTHKPRAKSPGEGKDGSNGPCVFFWGGSKWTI